MVLPTTSSNSPLVTTKNLDVPNKYIKKHLDKKERTVTTDKNVPSFPEKVPCFLKKLPSFPQKVAYFLEKVGCYLK